MKIRKIKQIAIAVKDIETAIKFYQKTLGFPLLFRAEPKMAFFDIEGVRLMLSQAEKVPGGGPILYFSVDDCTAAYKALGDKGGNCVREPVMTHKTETSELWLAFFKDPDGHLLALMEERAL
jgi:methylmalonyl-CoA/ethylmalonyl-CoA epimerase